ncbi:hypothetical protein BVRB_001520 [Beta vulgaris subsp. vulgaris]|uniref:Uncharacterized protein n=1 Tax=Beta vulgaris subsp. vulgaris TaxID=3555 RepID=A0A0J8B5B0_BETVV|nr:hypothetical protein BVRB_001520 [Beta vulgaris subsp. vulgaris]
MEGLYLLRSRLAYVCISWRKPIHIVMQLIDFNTQYQLFVSIIERYCKP